MDFEAVYVPYLPRIYNYVRYRVGDGHIAEDLTAEIFEQVFRNLKGYRKDKGAFTTWLFTIARRRIADHFRRRQRSPEWLPLDHVMDEGEPSHIEDTVVQADMEEQLHRALAMLPKRDQEVIALRFGAELSSRETAQQLGTTQGNVDVIVHRAIKKLRQYVTQKEDAK